MERLGARWPDAIRRRMRRGKGLLLLLDFDGTLSPIAPAPGAARMSAALRRRIAGLGKRPGVRVGVISGRVLEDVERRVGLAGLFYGGNHGLKVKGPGLRFLHPGAWVLKPAIREAEGICRAAFGGVSGAEVEAKGLTLAVHNRRVPPAGMKAFRRRLRWAQDAARKLPVVWRRGSRVWEVLPRVAWDKGEAARLLLRRLGGPVPVAVGDDVSDEPLFRAANGTGISVRVAPDGPSSARYAVARQADVAVFLKELDRIIGENIGRNGGIA